MKMRKQRLMGLAMLAITALILVMARGGRTPEDSDATAAFLTGPLGLYMLLSKTYILYDGEEQEAGGQFQSTLPVRGATAKMPKTEPFILSNFHNFKKYTDRTRTKVIIKMELWINLSPFSGANRTGNLWSLLLRTLKGS